jgi:serine protease AprX
MKKYSLLTFLLITFLGFSQYDEAFKKVREATNIEGLKTLQLRFSQEQKDRDTRLEKYFNDNPTKQKRWEDGEVTFEIYDVIDGVEQIVRTANANSAITSRTNKLYNGGGLGLNVEGQGMTAYVWDSGAVRSTHVEFPNGKVTNMDSTNTIFHATHVTGTIAAQGVSTSAKGIAFNSTVGAYDWNSDLAEMTIQLGNTESMLISNHSYTRSPNPLPSWFFGAYSSGARDYDEIAFNAPFYLPIVAAGNSRNDFNNSAVSSHLGFKGGYDLIFGFQTAKNILTVGAVNEVLNYTNNWDVIMSEFSSWGPTDDGRIKPEIVTKGVSVRSTGSTGDNIYSTANGTSMAAPAIAGNALLLQQHFKNLNNSFMKASTLKGIILHSADEAGANNGPDYEFGWGLMNAQKAAMIISNVSNQNSLIHELTLNNNETKTIQIKANGNEPLKVSLSWTDKASTANNGIVDDQALKLVNDLDLRVIKDTQTFFPWTLNPQEFWSPAINTTDNFRDNFERIDLTNPIANGIYTIQISHKNNLDGNLQSYSLIASGITEVLATEQHYNSKQIEIYPVPTNDFLHINNLDVNENTEFYVYHIGGQLLLNGVLNNSATQTIDVSNLSTGVYFIKIFNDNRHTNLKFTIK